MSIISKLASSLGRRDEEPNEALAADIIASKDKNAIKELIAGLNNKDKKIQSDCINVLYEVGQITPKLISNYAKEFIALLDSKNNRLQWGAMIALDAITAEAPYDIYPALGKIVDVADKGTVITRDHCVGILVKLCATPQYADDAFELFLAQLKAAPVNQLPMYAELAIPVITGSNKASFIHVLTTRLPEVDKEPKRLRIEKVQRKINK